MNEGTVDQKLLARIAEGDEEAFAVLYRHFYSGLRPIGWRCIKSGIEPAEVLQMTFLKVWLNRELLPEIGNLRAWIVKVAYREYLMAVRQKMNYAARVEKVASWTAAEEKQDSAGGPFQHIHYQELKRVVQAAVQTLSPQRKTIYELSRNEGLTIEEIAARLSISPNTAKSALQTSLKLIREKLVEAGYGPLSIIILLQFLNNR